MWSLNAYYDNKLKTLKYICRLYSLYRVCSVYIEYALFSFFFGCLGISSSEWKNLLLKYIKTYKAAQEKLRNQIKKKETLIKSCNKEVLNKKHVCVYER